MSRSPPAGQSRPELPGGVRHQVVLWLKQVGVLQPVLEQVHLREIVRDAWQTVQGEGRKPPWSNRGGWWKSWCSTG